VENEQHRRTWTRDWTIGTDGAWLSRPTIPDLSGADLHAREFDYFDFRGTNFSGANLSGAQFINAQFDRSQCKGTVFRNARLPDTSWEVRI